VKDEVLKKVATSIPEHGGKNGRRKDEFPVSNRGKKIVEKKKHDKCSGHIEERKKHNEWSLGKKCRQGPNQFCLDHNAKNKTEKQQSLDKGKEKCEKKLFPLPPDKTLCSLAEDDLKGGTYYGKKPSGEKEEKKETEGPRKPLGQRNEIQLLENLFCNYNVIRVRYDSFEKFLKVEAGVAEIDYVTENENREKGKWDKGKKDIKGYGRDNDVPMIFLIFFEESFYYLKD